MPPRQACDTLKEATVPGLGPAPNPNRRRVNKDTFGGPQTVRADGRTRGPALKGTWSAATRSWYNTWRKSPQASLFTATDWQRLTMLAPLVERFFAEPDVKLMTEIRQNETLLGATHLDRLRTRISIETSDRQSAALATVTPADDYRRNLGA